MRIPWTNPPFTSKTSKVLTHPILDGLIWNTLLESHDAKSNDNWSPRYWIPTIELMGELP